MISNTSIRRVSLCTCCIALMLAPVILYALVHTRVGAANVYKWLPSSNTQQVLYQRTVDEFGNDQAVLVSWDGCRVDHPGTILFEQQLEKAQHSHPQIIKKFLSTRQTLATLTAPPLSLDPSIASRRAKGVLLGEEQCGLFIVFFRDDAVDQPGSAIETLRRCADNVPDLGRSKLRLAGPLFESYCVDESVTRSLMTFAPFSTVVAWAVACLSLRSFIDAGIAFILAAAGQLTSLAIVYYSGGQFNAALAVLPTLTFMLTLSGAIHLIGYWRRAGQNNSQSAENALRQGFSPCVLSSITTIIGMTSLAVSKLQPVQSFGIYCGVSLAIATILLLGLFPALIGLRHRLQSPTVRQPSGHCEAMIRNYVNFLEQWKYWIFLSGVAIVLLGSVATFKVQVGTKLSGMYESSHPVVDSLRWFEANIGPVSSVDVIVSFDAKQVGTIEQLQVLEKIRNGIQAASTNRPVWSALSVLPLIPDGRSIADTVKRSVIKSAVENDRAGLREAGLLYASGDLRRWRLVVKVTAFGQSYAPILREISEATQAIQHSVEPDARPTIEVTGITPLAYATQTIMAADLLSSLAMAFALITPLMIWQSRSLVRGLLYMLPNLFPVVTVLGTMACLRLPVDIGGILCSTVALGIAIDDTLHLTAHYEANKHGRNVRSAIKSSLLACLGAMTATTAISCAAMLPFALSEFVPTQQFAILIVAMLSLAWVGDVLLLPAILLCIDERQSGAR